MSAQIDVVKELLALDILCGESLAWLLADGEKLGKVEPEVSRWSPRMQLDHAALATAAICDFVGRILAADPECVAAGSPSVQLRALLGAGRIPRGVADSPAGLRPAESVSADEARAHLLDARRLVAALSDRHDAIMCADRRLPHFALGPMTSSQWIAFARIHFEHHAAIAREAAEREEPAGD